MRKTEVRRAAYHITSGVIFLLSSVALYALQALFSYNVLSSSTWDWPQELLPTGYITASAILLLAVLAIMVGCTDSRNCLTVLLVVNVCCLIICSAVGASGIVYHDQFDREKFSILTLTVLTLSVAVLCVIHVLVACADLCDCGTRKTMQTASTLPQPALPLQFQQQSLGFPSNYVNGPPRLLYPVNSVAPMVTTYNPAVNLGVHFASHPSTDSKSSIEPNAPPPYAQ